MSGVVHFKFGHAQGFDRLTFEGHFISVGDLKRLITEKRQLGSGPAGALRTPLVCSTPSPPETPPRVGTSVAISGSSRVQPVVLYTQ